MWLSITVLSLELTFHSGKPKIPEPLGNTIRKLLLCFKWNTLWCVNRLYYPLRLSNLIGSDLLSHGWPHSPFWRRNLVVLVFDTSWLFTRLAINFLRSAAGGLRPEHWSCTKHPIFKSFIITFCQLAWCLYCRDGTTCGTIKMCFFWKL